MKRSKWFKNYNGNNEGIRTMNPPRPIKPSDIRNGIIDKDILNDYLKTLDKTLDKALPEGYKYDPKENNIGQMIINRIKLGYEIPIDWVLAYNISIKL